MICFGKQSGQPYDSQEKVEVFVYIGFGYEAKYLQKILKRRKITGRDMLRKAIRALVEVVNKKDVFKSKVSLSPYEEESENSYDYERLSRMDFARSIYVR